MKTGVQPVDHTNAARGGLQVQRQSTRHRRFHAVLDLHILLATGVALQPGHGQRAAAGLGELLDQGELGIKALRALHQVKVTDHLHHAVGQAGKGRAQTVQLGRAGDGGGRIVAFDGAVVVRAPCRKARCTGLQSGAQMTAHGGHVRVGGRFARLGAFAHHQHAQRVVRHHGQKVQAVRHGV